MKLTVFHADTGTLLDKIEENLQRSQVRLWAKVRHIGPLIYFDENGSPYEEIVTEESITDPEFINDMLFLPVTDNHPSEFVTEANRRDLACGYTGSQPAVDEDGFLIDLALFDKVLIQKYLDGKRDVSLGYKSVVELREDGKWYQVKCKPNHLAIVEEGRAPKARIVYPARGDSIIWDAKFKRGNMKTISIDGNSYEVEDAVASAYDNVNKLYVDMKKAYDKLKEEFDGMMKKLNAADAKIDEYKEQLSHKVDEAQVIEQVKQEFATRYRVVDAAKSFNLKEKYSVDEDSLGLMKRFIKEVRPARSLEGKSVDYIHASFDSIVEALEELQKQEELIIEEEEEDIIEEEEKDSAPTVSSLIKRSVAKKTNSSSALEEYKRVLSEAHLLK